MTRILLHEKTAFIDIFLIFEPGQSMGVLTMTRIFRRMSNKITSSQLNPDFSGYRVPIFTK